MMPKGFVQVVAEPLHGHTHDCSAVRDFNRWETDSELDAARWFSIGGGYRVFEDASRRGGLPSHFQVYGPRGNRLPGIIVKATGEVQRHAGVEAAIPKSVLKRMVAKGLLRTVTAGMVMIITELFCVEPLEAPTIY
jgi:hypothetical protein